MEITSTYSVFRICTLFCLTRNAFSKQCPAKQGFVNGVCQATCSTKCFGIKYGPSCQLSCTCTSLEECNHIHGCVTMLTSGLEITGLSITTTQPATVPNKWFFIYIIIVAIILAVTFLLCVLRRRLSSCTKTLHFKAHDEAIQLRVTNTSVCQGHEERALSYLSSLEIQEDVYSEIRESQVIRRVLSSSQINTLMNESIVVSTTNQSRSSDIYNHTDHFYSNDNVDAGFESEYANAIHQWV